MKLKFTADPKDWLMFILMVIFLFYLVSIGVLNFHSLATDAKFYGLNPIPGMFAPDMIKPILVLFILVMILVFTTVNSYFFDRESGLGFSTSKKEKGYSRWAKDVEMKRELKPVRTNAEESDVAGVPLICDGNTMWVDNGEYHNLVIGATGSGKTVITILPAVKVLAKKGESIIVTDPKGEIFEKTSNMLKNKGYKIVVLNLRDPQQGNAWNPFQLPYKLYKSGNTDKSTELLDDLAINILYDEKSQANDPFWEKTSADYFTGLALGLFEDAKEGEINLNSINYMSTVGEDKFAASTYIKEYFNLKDPTKPAYVNASSTINAPTDTKGGILAVFRQKIKLFSSKENLSEMLSHSDFDMSDFGKEKTAVFIVIQDEKKTYHSLATIFLKQTYESLIDVAQQNGGKLPIRVNFLLDEFANMPPLKDVTTMITAARSRQIRFTFIIQNFAQLTQVYGKENAETIRGNCGNIVYLISTELQALEEISKLCGEVKSKEKEKTSSTPLVTISDLQRMRQFEMIVLRLRLNPFKTKFVPDFKINWGTEDFGKGEFISREKSEVHIFDLKKFVKEKKQSNLFAALGEDDNNSSSSFNPFASESSSNPFASNSSPNPFGFPKDDNDDEEFNVDELVKKIDAKIAELEEEEKKEKENKSKEETTNEEQSILPSIDNIEITPQPINVSNNYNNPLETDNYDHEYIVNEPVNLVNTSSIPKLNNDEKKVDKHIPDIHKVIVPTEDNEIKQNQTPIISGKPDIHKVIIPEQKNINDTYIDSDSYYKKEEQTKVESSTSDDQFFDDFFNDD